MLLFLRHLDIGYRAWTIKDLGDLFETVTSDFWKAPPSNKEEDHQEAAKHDVVVPAYVLKAYETSQPVLHQV